MINRKPAYVIHPWGHTQEEWDRNTESVEEFMLALWRIGYNPVFAPFFNSHVKATWQEYIDADLLLIDKLGLAIFCGEVESPGCTVEIQHCLDNEIRLLHSPVPYVIGDFSGWEKQKAEEAE